MSVQLIVKSKTKGNNLSVKIPKPSVSQMKWLNGGLNQPGGKLPLFDLHGKKISRRTVESCIKRGWVEPWFLNPIKPDWLVCKLTKKGRSIAEK